MAVDNAAMFPFEISADISAVPFDPVILNFQPMGSRGSRIQQVLSQLMLPAYELMQLGDCAFRTFKHVKNAEAAFGCFHS